MFSFESDKRFWLQALYCIGDGNEPRGSVILRVII